MFETTTNTTKSIFIAVILGGLFYMAGQYIASQPQRIQKETEANRQISVEGTGKVEAKPDIATINLGVQTGPQTSAKAATDMLGQKFEAVVKTVKDKGVTTDDLKTMNVSVNPVYDYTNGQQNLKGYEASESIEVKIRDLDSVGEVLAAATAQGVNQAGGINFAIDRPEALQEQAETKAITEARERGQRLAKALGATLGSVKTFVTDGNDSPRPMPYAAVSKEGDQATGIAPPVPAGTNTITAHVTVTFELR